MLLEALKRSIKILKSVADSLDDKPIVPVRKINTVDIKETFEISIELWEHIANIPDTTKFNHDQEMTKYYLKELNFRKMINGCAFCDLMYRNGSDCDHCLLSSICADEYQTWKFEMNYGCGHVQFYAKEILDAIIQQYKYYLKTIGD